MESVILRGSYSPVLYCYPELLLISDVRPKEKYLAFEPRTGTTCQLHSQGKLPTPRRENRKIQNENVISKANKQLHKALEFSIYQMVVKAYVQIS
jgi:hypothetical protein